MNKSRVKAGLYTPPSGKTVLLAVTEDTFNVGLLNYAVSVSERSRTALDILYLVSPEARHTDLMEFISRYEKDGVRFIVVRREGCVKEAVLNYTRKKGGIQFVIIGPSPEFGCGAGEKVFSAAWEGLKCPLVVVSGNEAPLLA